MTPTLAWQIVSWVLSGIISGFIVVFVYGRASGRWQARVESNIAEAERARERMVERLDRGDKEFDEHLERLATLGGQLDRFGDAVSGLSGSLNRLVEQMVSHEAVEAAVATHALDCPARQRSRPPRNPA